MPNPHNLPRSPIGTKNVKFSQLHSASGNILALDSDGGLGDHISLGALWSRNNIIPAAGDGGDINYSEYGFDSATARTGQTEITTLVAAIESYIGTGSGPFNLFLEEVAPDGFIYGDIDLDGSTSVLSADTIALEKAADGNQAAMSEAEKQGLKRFYSNLSDYENIEPVKMSSFKAADFFYGKRIKQDGSLAGPNSGINGDFGDNVCIGTTTLSNLYDGNHFTVSNYDHTTSNGSSGILFFFDDDADQRSGTLNGLGYEEPPFDNQTNAYVGRYVASGSSLLDQLACDSSKTVAATHQDTNNDVYIYDRAGYRRAIFNPSGHIVDAIDVCGDRVIMGDTFYNNPSSINNGRAFIYNGLNQTTPSLSLTSTLVWEDRNVDYGSEENGGNFHFGGRVAISENYAVVLGRVGTNFNMGRGELYVYDLPVSGVQLSADRTITFSGLGLTVFGDHNELGFGLGLDLTDNYLVAGAPGWDASSGFETGKGAVVVMNPSTGALLWDKNSDDLNLRIGAQFGWSVAVNETCGLVAVGSPHWSGTGSPDPGLGNGYGAVYIFDLSGNYIDLLINPDTTVGNRFGWSVGLSDNMLIVGDPRHDDGSNQGAVYLYHTSNWT